ncbi:MAG: carboxypeptidase regulatory-like domain-containing protein, partial [Planctomycetota bacterium]
VSTASNLVSIEGGRFKMRVRPGEQRIRVQARSKGGPLAGTARREVAPGEHLDDLTLTAKRAAVLRGRLVAEDGSPIGRRWVMAVPVGEPMPTSRKLHASAVAAGDGSFALAVPAAGEYRVGLYETAADRDMARFAADPPPAIVKPGDHPITLVVPRVEATVTGQVLSGHDRQPVAHYEVRLVEFRDDLPWHYSIITARDKDGRFRFNDATGGRRYALEIAAKDHGLYRSDVFDLKRGQTLALPPIVLAGRGHVRGRVVDATGQPVPFARVAVLGPNLSISMHRPVTDLDGRFVPIAFAPGEHRLVAFIPSVGIGLATVRIAAGRTVDVEIKLPPAAPLVVVVRDATGQPAANVPVNFRPDLMAPLTSEHMFRLYLHGHPGQSYRTDGRGELRIGFLPPGEARISVAGKQETAELVAGSETKVEFQLE